MQVFSDHPTALFLTGHRFIQIRDRDKAKETDIFQQTYLTMILIIIILIISPSFC